MFVWRTRNILYNPEQEMECCPLQPLQIIGKARRDFKNEIV